MSVVLTEEELKSVIQGPSDIEWRYEMRRECQEILPNLFLGPFSASKSLEGLKALGVTHIVCLRDPKEAFSVRARFPDYFQYLTLDVVDNEEQNLIRIFPSAKDFIYRALAGGGRVLVHCNGGISISPSFVVMFVMQHYRLGWEDALHLVQNRRYCISPNGGFMTQLKEYEAIYRAALAAASFPTRDQPSRKRQQEHEDEEEREDDRKRMQVTNDPDAMETT